MARPFPSPHATTLGMGPTFLFVLFPAFVVAFTTPFVLVSNLLSVNWPHQALNLGLLAVLGAGYLAWRVGVFRGRLTAASGVGFGVAGYALGQRVFCEFLLSFFGGAPRSVWPESDFAQWIAFVRVSGLIGYVFGLAMVLAASLWERRLARDAPAWARPR
jgi:hypothetical protein